MSEQSKPMTLEDLIPMRDQMFRVGGKVVSEEPADSDIFMIVAGPWPQPIIGARQVVCQCCKAFASLTEKGYRLWQRNKLRVIVCSECGVKMHNYMQEMRVGGNDGAK